MTFKTDDFYVGKRLFVGEGFPLALGIGPAEARGSAYIEGPTITGAPLEFPIPQATSMIGPNRNTEVIPPVIFGAISGFNFSPYSLSVVGDACIFDNLTTNGMINVGTHVLAQGEVISRTLGGQHILSMKKNFDIPHPKKENWRLRHTCPEGPSNDVYHRGKINNQNHIDLPDYWETFVDIDSITVNITPIGSCQTIFVEKIENNKVYLNSNSEEPINCYYHIFAERSDGEKLIPEYEGTTPNDYPGNNDEYSVVGWNYDNIRGTK